MDTEKERKDRFLLKSQMHCAVRSARGISIIPPGVYGDFLKKIFFWPPWLGFLFPSNACAWAAIGVTIHFIGYFSLFALLMCCSFSSCVRDTDKGALATFHYTSSFLILLLVHLSLACY